MNYDYDFEADAYCWCYRFNSNASDMARRMDKWKRRLNFAFLSLGTVSIVLGAVILLSCYSPEQHIAKRVYWPEASSMLQVNGRRAYPGVTKP